MPNTIAENLQRLQNARTAIFTAITDKGGTVPTGAGFEDFPTAINTIAGNTAAITSTPPISFRSNGQPLVDWEIEGSSGGVGKRTKNLVNLANTQDRTSSGVTFHVDSETGTVTITGNGSNTGQVTGKNASLPAVSKTTNLYMTGYDGEIAGVNIYVWDMTTGARPTKWDGVTSSSAVSRVTREVEIQLLPEHKYTINFRVNAEFTSSGEILKPMLRLPDTSADFIPYGYEIPVICGGTTTDIFIGDSPLTEGESITKAEANVDIPTSNGNNNLIVDTVAQPDSVTIQYYNYVAGIPYNTDGLCLYFASDIGRVRMLPQTDHEPDVSSLNSAPYSLTGFDDTTIEVRFTMPENFTDKARLIELGNHDGVMLALNLNQDNIEVYANGTWAESFSTTFTGGETYTLSVTIGSGDIKIYVNGVYVEADTYTTFTVAGPIIAFANGGAIGMDTRWWPATSDISKVRVYDRVLTAAEIAANYQIDNPT